MTEFYDAVEQQRQTLELERQAKQIIIGKGAAAIFNRESRGAVAGGQRDNGIFF